MERMSLFLVYRKGPSRERIVGDMIEKDLLEEYDRQ